MSFNISMQSDNLKTITQTLTSKTLLQIRKTLKKRTKNRKMNEETNYKHISHQKTTDFLLIQYCKPRPAVRK